MLAIPVQVGDYEDKDEHDSPLIFSVRPRYFDSGVPVLIDPRGWGGDRI